MTAPTVTAEISQLGHLDADKQALIERLTALEKEITQYSQRWTQNKIEAGKILLQLREGVPHGEWEPQLKEICKATGIGRSTAYRYLDLAQGKKVKEDTKTSKNGYPLDELRSYLHKSLRLGDEKAAMQCAVKLSVSGKDESTWRLLKDVFPSEDVGLARIGLLAELDSLYKAWKRTKNDLRFHAYRLPLTHAVLLLCRVMKSRLVDHALITYYENQQPIEIPEDCKEPAAAMYDSEEPIDIPGAAVDKHTARGRNKLKRKGAAGINHFFDVGATLKNESPAIADPYKESARQALLQKVGAKGGQPEPPTPTAPEPDEHEAAPVPEPTEADDREGSHLYSSDEDLRDIIEDFSEMAVDAFDVKTVFDVEPYLVWDGRVGDYEIKGKSEKKIRAAIHAHCKQFPHDREEDAKLTSHKLWQIVATFTCDDPECISEDGATDKIVPYKKVRTLDGFKTEQAARDCIARQEPPSEPDEHDAEQARLRAEYEAAPLPQPVEA